ncbi:unnamed protein product [Linum tenue]|uniref:Uncharacterized protein n=1 Tax=Linum tenue TaxID=586396 RepID=A0AAV0JYC0_9ROSI|nr:unnamed protein product [Linum tenue]
MWGYIDDGDVHHVDEVAGDERQRMHHLRPKRRRRVPGRQLPEEGRAGGLPHGPQGQSRLHDTQDGFLLVPVFVEEVEGLPMRRGDGVVCCREEEIIRDDGFVLRGPV